MRHVSAEGRFPALLEVVRGTDPYHGTYGTLRMLAGVDPRTGQDLLGHSTMRMTPRYVQAVGRAGRGREGVHAGAEGAGRLSPRAPG